MRAFRAWNFSSYSPRNRWHIHSREIQQKRQNINVVERRIRFVSRKDTLEASTHGEEKLRIPILEPFQARIEAREPLKVMQGDVTVLTTPTVDTVGTSLLLGFEDKRYLFGNVHEGFQRACIQNGTKLGKLNTIFLTGKTEWANTGGLLGLILTVADIVKSSTEALKESIHEKQAKFEKRMKDSKSEGFLRKMSGQAQPIDELENIQNPSLNLFGGDNLMQLLATARRFIFRKGMPLNVSEHTEPTSSLAPTWQDTNIQVWAMPLRPTNRASDAASKSPRKRSHQDFLEGIIDPDKETLPRSQQLLQIISNMFDSTWRMDALVETPLSEVKLPAALFIRNPETKAIERYDGPKPGSAEPLPNIKVLVRKPWPGALVATLPETTPSPVSMSYIARGFPQRGKFDPKRAVALGVKPGPDYANLTKGISVQNDKGETITSEQVVGETRPGKGFAVIELPTEEYITSLRSSPVFQSKETMNGIEAFFWILGPGLTQTAAFQELVAGLTSQKHIISSSDHCADYLTIDAAASAQLQHWSIDNQRFDVPLHNNKTQPLPSALSNCTIATRGIQLEMTAKEGKEVKLSTHMKPGPLNTVQVIDQMSKNVVKLAHQAEKSLEDLQFKQEYDGQQLVDGDTEIITLGTGSAVPSKQRNVSATLIRVPGVGSYLLDAGENTLGQLSRLYATEDLKEVLKDLKVIWISHMHADHHLGLTSIIKAWHTAVYGDPKTHKGPAVRLTDQLADPAAHLINEQKLCIVSEHTMLAWLQDYSEIENYGYDRIVPMCVTPMHFNEEDRVVQPTKLTWHKQPLGFNRIDSQMNKAMRAATGLSNLESVHVSHCAGARAVTMSWPSGLKISYSGDCRPSLRFAKMGQDSTLLIHEATFEDNRIGDARAKKHSTAPEAIRIGLEMKAKRLILTHFSQRYTKAPDIASVVKQTNIKFDDADKGVENASDPDDMQPLEDEESEGTSVNSKGAEDSTESIDSGLKQNAMETREVVEAAKEMKIGSAYDSMRVKLKDIILLDKYKPAFERLYDEPDHAASVSKAERKAEQQAINEAKIAEKQAKMHAKQRKSSTTSKATNENEQISAPGNNTSNVAESTSEMGPKVDLGTLPDASSSLPTDSSTSQ